MTAEEWVVDYLVRHGPTAPLMIVISKPSHIRGSIWQAMDTLRDRSRLIYTPLEVGPTGCVQLKTPIEDLKVMNESTPATNATFENYMEVLIAKYDLVSGDIRSMVTAPGHLNNESRDLLDAKKAQAEIIRDIFQLKCIMSDATKAVRERETLGLDQLP